MKSAIETVNSNSKTLAKLPNHYDISVCDIWEIADTAGMKLNEDIMTAIETAYKYGFIKGSRYEKNRSRVKYSEKIANETSAAYSYGVIMGRQQKENESKG